VPPHEQLERAVISTRDAFGELAIVESGSRSV
jgi:hypothetical protein